jgi:hypothetical protein
MADGAAGAICAQLFRAFECVYVCAGGGRRWVPFSPELGYATKSSFSCCGKGVGGCRSRLKFMSSNERDAPPHTPFDITGAWWRQHSRGSSRRKTKTALVTHIVYVYWEFVLISSRRAVTNNSIVDCSGFPYYSSMPKWLNNLENSGF